MSIKKSQDCLLKLDHPIKVLVGSRQAEMR